MTRLGKLAKVGKNEAFRGITSDYTIYVPKCTSLKCRDFTSVWGFCEDNKIPLVFIGKLHIIQLIDFEVGFTFYFIILFEI
jgi:hypothetical protein